MQEEHWRPLFKWVKGKYDVELNIAEGFSPARQSEKTKEILKSVVEQMDHWELAGEAPFNDISTLTSVEDCPHMTGKGRTIELTSLIAFERAVYATKSFIIALALVQGRITAHQAAEAAHVEVRSQIEKWGEVEDSKSFHSFSVSFHYSLRF